ncbi:copper resistance protein CopC [Glaciimonas sp. PCH181]|uniref:copper resistance CopC family protein n=1 Tax=Glaciimonas sp. PCH181 TaxID=2133943 RepID=UPI000D3D1466|nr:copper resistance protein CopC [Glaciimonas sp. PCH181]PUA20501.1 copper resistance protein [Glaciimonas sp. PCH181]
MRNASFYLSTRAVFLRSFLRLLTVVGALCVGGIGQAWAHAQPDTQSPLAGEIVSAPSEVKITYNEALEPAFSSLIVSDAKGKQVNSAKAEVDATTHKTMRVPLPALGAGKYQVKWVAVADDGHRTQGSFNFTVK